MFYTEIWLLRNRTAFCFGEISLIFPSRIFHLLEVSSIFSQILPGLLHGVRPSIESIVRRESVLGNQLSQPLLIVMPLTSGLTLLACPFFYPPENNWLNATESKLSSQINMSSVGWGEPNELFIPLDPTSHVSGPEFWRHACTVTWTFPKDECWLKHR